MAKEKYNSIRKRVFQIIQIGNTSDFWSKTFDFVIVLSILLNLFVVFFETFDMSADYYGILCDIERVTVIIFTAEYALRLWTADYLYPKEKHLLGAELKFIFSLYGLIDLLCFLPYYLPIVFPSGIVAFRILRVIRIFRLFRINAYYDAFNVITDVLKEKKNQIFSAVFIILMLVMASSLIMYNLEHEAQPESFKNAFSGIWWAVSTLLTVGYGDIYPITNIGRFVGILLAFLGVGLVAIPTGIISAGFVEQYSRVKNLSSASPEYPVSFVTLSIDKVHEWAGEKIRDINVPKGLLIIAVKRDEETLVANGNLVIYPGDKVLIGAEHAKDDMGILLTEVLIKEENEWIGERLADLDIDDDMLIVMIKRGHKTLIPTGTTMIHEGDMLLVYKQKRRLM